ncbi:MAG: DUF2239 family protein [Burkholderiaceae bacterium]
MPAPVTEPEFLAFLDKRLLLRGPMPRLIKECLSHAQAPLSAAGARLAVYDAQTGGVIDLDWRGTEADVLRRLVDHPVLGKAVGQPPAHSKEPSPPATRRPGRPRLGVTSREVSLLPRHWAWLNEQPGGASASLRRLVDAARSQPDPQRGQRRQREAAYRFMADLAGDEPGFEAASRALFADDQAALAQAIRDWPQDVREQVTRFLTPADA